MQRVSEVKETQHAHDERRSERKIGSERCHTSQAAMYGAKVDTAHLNFTSFKVASLILVRQRSSFALKIGLDFPSLSLIIKLKLVG